MKRIIVMLALLAFVIMAGCINGPPYYVVADVNNDGVSDTVLTVYDDTSYEDKIFILLGGISESLAQKELAVDNIEKQSTIVMDINKDGFSDIIYKIHSKNEWKVVYGKGNGSFEKSKGMEINDMKYIKMEMNKSS